VYGSDAKLPALLATLANCAKARSASVYNGCKARDPFELPPSMVRLAGRRGAGEGNKAIYGQRLP
jgi:hypothetical protein